MVSDYTREDGSFDIDGYLTDLARRRAHILARLEELRRNGDTVSDA
jgi:hypothetical protein